MSEMAQALAELMGSNMPRHSRPPRPEAGAQILTLTELADAYLTPNPWKPKDLVTIRKGLGLNGAGEPCMVVETAGHGDFLTDTTAEAGDVTFGSRLNVRIMMLSQDYVCYWVEHWQLVPWTGEMPV